MRQADVDALVELLVAAYPSSQKAHADGMLKLIRDQLRPLDATIARKAVEAVVARSRWFPSIADLARAYEIAQRQSVAPRRDSIPAEELPDPSPEERNAMLTAAREFAARKWGS